MTNKDFILEVQKLCHIEHSQCTLCLNGLCKLLAQAGVEQIPVTLPGLGTFVSHKHPEYIQEDPQTGKMTLFPPRISYRMQTEDQDSQSDLLARQLAEQTHTDETETAAILRAVVEVIFGALDHGEEVEIKGLGTFRNIVTRQGELQRVAYTPDDQMRSLVNAPFNCFEPIVTDEGFASDDEPIAAVAQVAAEAETLNQSIGEEQAVIGEEQAADEPEAENPTQAEVENAEVSAIETQEETPEIQTEYADVQKDSASMQDEEVAADKQQEETPEEQQEESEPEGSEEPEEGPKEEVKDVIIPAIGPEPIQPHEDTTSAKKDEDNYFESLHKKPDSTHNRLLLTACSIVVIACIALLLWILNLDNDEDDYSPDANLAVNTEVEDIIVPDTDVAEDDTLPIYLDTADIQNPVPATIDTPEQTASIDAPAAETKAEVKTEIAQTSASQGAAVSESPKPVALSNDMLSFNADGTVKTHTMAPGERLTLVALKYYGDKFFWPYIYEVNRDKIKSPSLVSVGMVLELPSAEYFGIDADNPASVSKAKAKAAALLN